MFEDFENEIEDSETVEQTVYRVYGGDSTLEGGFITDEKPKNPIQARADLGLSQHFENEDGETKRNLANMVAELKIETTPEGEILDKENEATGHQLEFTTVAPPEDQEPAGYQPGGGQEYQLEDPFDEVIEVVDVQPLRHQPTEGWTEYVEKEQVIMENAASGEPSTAIETVEDIAPVETAEDVTPVETVEETTSTETVEDDASEEYSGWEY